MGPHDAALSPGACSRGDAGSGGQGYHPLSANRNPTTSIQRIGYAAPVSPHANPTELEARGVAVGCRKRVVSAVFGVPGFRLAGELKKTLEQTELMSRKTSGNGGVSLASETAGKMPTLGGGGSRWSAGVSPALRDATP